jgi:hypothetical protein
MRSNSININGFDSVCFAVGTGPKLVTINLQPMPNIFFQATKVTDAQGTSFLLVLDAGAGKLYKINLLNINFISIK